MDNLARAKYVITYLEQENKKLSDKQVLMELDFSKERGKVTKASQ